MKRLVAINILCSMFLGSFYAQELNASTILEGTVTIHNESDNSGNNYHKKLAFSEPVNETEDSDEKSNSEIQYQSFQNIISENKYFKNPLNSLDLNFSTCFDLKSHLPIFLKTRSIII